MAEARGDVKMKLLSFVALFMMLGGFYVNFLVSVICISQLPSLWAITVLAVWLTFAFLPAEYESPLGSRVARFIIKYTINYFPMKVVIEDESAFDPNQAYVIAAEPHSVLPLGVLLFTPQCGIFPVPKVRGLASKAIFWSPGVRHIWTWLGSAPVTRESFTELLKKGITCVVVPGGVQECLHMKKGREVVFLKNRYGFIKVAMETGSPLVPTFCFGQSNAYKWWRPTGKWYTHLSRTIGFTPLVYWGKFGLSVPFPEPMYCVVGKPIAVTKNTNPSREEVAVVHGQFIEAFEALFEKHKGDLGFEGTSLEIC
jgi:1-acyl-sn-glycerol-3-phosphate acyltransferase